MTPHGPNVRCITDQNNPHDSELQKLLGVVAPTGNTWWWMTAFPVTDKFWKRKQTRVPSLIAMMYTREINKIKDKHITVLTFPTRHNIHANLTNKINIEHSRTVLMPERLLTSYQSLLNLDTDGHAGTRQDNNTDPLIRKPDFRTCSNVNR